MARDTSLDEVRVVLKFRVTIDGQWHGVLLPPGSNIIHVGNVEPNRRILPSKWLHFWAESPDPRDEPINRQFRVYGTGEPIEDPSAKWAGTFIEDGFIWHLYMKGA